ncbi:response regulator, partial [Escherichia coli]
TVDTVAEALRVIALDAALDLVLADVSLADGSGVEVARAAQGRGLPVLFVTGSFPEEARALAAGCLAKPYP